jgi:Rrf2 family iron-sulfur cluster assembly transcriptional regulator
MRITTQGDYALRCILNIASHGKEGPVSIGRIAQDEQLPLDYIEQLLMKLRRKKLIKSIRGARGGYLLNRKAAAVSVKDVLEAVEGEAFEVICSRKKKTKKNKCDGSKGCALKDVWFHLKNQIESYLKDITIEALLSKRGVVR